MTPMTTAVIRACVQVKLTTENGHVPLHATATDSARDVHHHVNHTVCRSRPRNATCLDGRSRQEDKLVSVAAGTVCGYCIGNRQV